MAAAITPADETLHHLHRLSQKPGVQSTLILTRATGSIVRASGLLVSEAPVKAGNENDSATTNGTTASTVNDTGYRDRPNVSDQQPGKLHNADDVARAVWKFFGAAGGMIDDLGGEGEDEVRLLRLRMKRCEVVVVPDAKFLLVVVHDTPLA